MRAFTALLLGCVLGNTSLALAPVPAPLALDPMARGYLGITLGEGVIIDRAEPGAPAAKAGLQSGDVIVRVGTLTPANYNQVIAHVCSFRPGAIVEVEVQRAGARKTFKVTLACRPLELDAPGRYPGQPFPIDD
jgi:S1-C subfamily serine protease